MYICYNFLGRHFKKKGKYDMRKLKKTLMALLIVCGFIFMPLSSLDTVSASQNILPKAKDNLVIGLRSKSKIVKIKDGYMRVFYDEKKICIEYYDNNFVIKSKKNLPMELNLWGGFYEGKDAYYIVEGQNNTKENDNAEVIRVIKYDKNWNKKGTAKITGNPELFGGEVRFPFEYGSVEMTEYNNKLYIVTGHEGYVDPAYNQGHQGFLMMEVDEKNMTGEIVDCDLWHSFAQYIDRVGSDLYILEQSEGSRYTKLSKYDLKSMEKKSIPVLQYGGSRDSAWAIPCYASVDDMAVSSNNVLCLGTSIDQTKYDSVNSKTAHNIYLTVTPTSKFEKNATKVKWITSFKDNGESFLGVKITKVNDNRFMISWEEYGKEKKPDLNDGLSGGTLHYVFIDENGNKISKEYTANAPISDCKPILSGNKIVYYASSSNMVDFYWIDANNGKFEKKIYRVAGESAEWSIKNGVLTITGTGEINVDTEEHYRYPLSSTGGGYSYYSEDNVWKNIKSNIKKIVVEKGITKIPDEEFSYFENLTEVCLKDGVKSIGKKAFYGCAKLKKVIIPSTVKSIGQSAFDTGYFWVGTGNAVIDAVIYAPKDSYAISYAKKNKIKYVYYTEKTNVKSNAKPKIKAPKKAVITNISKKNSKTINVKWKKIKGVTGYKIQYSKNAKFKKSKTITIKKKNATSKKITKLRTKTKYYVRVCAYKKEKGKTYKGKWSTPKKIKI